MNTPLVTVDGIGPSTTARSPVRELLALLRLALFLRVDGREIPGREPTIALLAGIALAAWITVDPLLHSRELVFTWLAVPDLTAIMAGLLGLAWLLHKLARPSLEYRRALVLTLGALPLAMMGEVASWKLVESSLRMVVGALSLYALA